MTSQFVQSINNEIATNMKTNTLQQQGTVMIKICDKFMTNLIYDI